MESQKEQKPLTSQNDNFTFEDVIEWILNKMGLRLNEEYTLNEIIDRVMSTGNKVTSINGKDFDTDLYLLIRDQVQSTVKRHVFLNIMEGDDEKRYNFEKVFERGKEKVRLVEANIVSHQNTLTIEHFLKLVVETKDGEISLLGCHLINN